MQAETPAAVDAAHQALVLDLLRQHGPLTLVEIVRHARRAAGELFIGPKVIPARDRLLEAGQIEQDGKHYRLVQPSAPATTVVNIRDLPDGWQQDPRYVYIGRQNAHYGVSASKWANPFVIGRDGDRAAVIEKYRERLHASSALLAAVPELAGKRLVCWCAPEACHGDVLADLANRHAAGEQFAPPPASTPQQPAQEPGTKPVLSTQIKAYLQRHGPSTRGALRSALECDLKSLLSAVQALKLLGTVTELFGELRLAVRPGLQGAMGYADIATRRTIRTRLERSAGLG